MSTGRVSAVGRANILAQISGGKWQDKTSFIDRPLTDLDLFEKHLDP